MPKTEKIKIYYLASGNISIPIYEALAHSERLELVGVGSQSKPSVSDGPARTKKTPLVKYCEEKGCPVELLRTVNSEEFLEHLRALGVEMVVVASFGQLLKAPLLELPPYGCLNVHASLLPRFRGAAPIVAALLAGDARTGVCFMKMDIGLDTGPVYRTSVLDILPEDDSATLEQRLGVKAAEDIEGVIVDIVENGLQPVPQPAEGMSLVKKISKEDGKADWTRSARELVNMSRAFRPWPSLKCVMPFASNGKEGSKIVKIQQAELTDGPDTGAAPGDILAYGREGIVVACGEGALRITRVIPEGKKEMSAGDYLLGSPLPKTEHLRMGDFPKEK